MNTQPWMADAVCRGMDPNLFQPGRGDDTSAAKAVCAECGVRAECLAYALLQRQGGIWGGTSERERRKMQRGMHLRVAPHRTQVSMTPEAVRQRALRSRRAS